MAQVPFSRGDLLKNLLVDNSGLDTSEPLPDVPNEKKLLWFQNIVGVNEKDFRTDMTKYMKNVDGKIEFHHPNGAKVKAGAFSLVRLGDLMQTFEAKSTKAPKPYPHFEIVTRLDNASLRFVDVSFVQSLPENAGALFQVASNFNGTEAQTELQEPDSENFTTKYVYDKTQGPAASISAGGAAISRVYGVFMDKSANPSDWAQTGERQINFLEQLAEHFPVTNGYVTCKDPEPRFPRKQWKKLLGSAHIGFHQGVQVTTGYRYSDMTHKHQIIDQCFCAAMNLQQGGTGARNKGLPDGELKAQFLLDAAYHGTYLTALNNKKTQIFLTLIGGGAFGNDKAWIFDSIFYAHQKWSRNDSSELQKVFLNKLRINNIPYTLVAYHNSKKIILEDFFV